MIRTAPDDTVLHFAVDLAPPSVNNCYKRSLKGVYLTKAAKDWSAYAGWIIKACTPNKVFSKAFFPRTVKVGIELYPRPQGNDLDNVLKLTLDVLTKQRIYIDDKYVKRLEMVKHDYNPTWKQGRILINVNETR